MGLLLGSGSTKPQYPYDMWYGVQGDFTSRDYKLKRVGNLDLHKTLPIQAKVKRFVENTDGSVKYYLHPNDSRKKESGAAAIIDSTDGNVMLEKPEYYFRLEFEGTKWLRAWSEYPLPGFIKMERKTISPWFATIDRTNTIAVSGCWLLWNGDEITRDSNGIVQLSSNADRFRGGSGSDTAKDGKYNSQLGMARTSISKAGARPYCKNGTHLGAYRAYNEIAWLQRCEYASLHCQDTYNETLTSEGYHQGGLGDGCTTISGTDWSNWGGYYPFVPCGVTCTLGNNTGIVSYTIKNWGGADKVVKVSSYRGLEAPFNYLWMLADDLLLYHGNDVSTAYVCEDPKKFTSHSDSATTVPDGYEAITDLPRTSGYVLQFAHSSKGAYSFPETVGGAANAGGCDYYWTPASDASPGRGWYGALLSASALNGAYAGFGCLTAGSRSSYSYAYIGFRLCRF